MAKDTFEGKLFTTDWNEEWKALQHARGHADNPEVWNKKAATSRFAAVLAATLTHHADNCAKRSQKAEDNRSVVSEVIC